MSVSLRQLLEDPDAPEVPIRGLAVDSREVRPGDAFVAISGDRSDGQDYVAEACRNGAVAVLSERPLAAGLELEGCPAVVVPDLKLRRGALAARVHEWPSRRLRCIGVTGTNGKTSIAHFIADLAGRLGRTAGYMGTIGWGRPGALERTRLTTEDGVTVQRRLGQLLDAGCDWVAMEVSSHALSQGRVAEVEFDVAVLSNLSRDHLDYHQTEAAYADAKASLFRWPSLDTAVVNLDDAFGRRVARSLGPGVALLGYGRQAELGWHDLVFTDQGVRGRWRSPWGAADLALPLAGEFSVANMAAAIGALCCSGLAFDDVVEAAASVAQVPGRMEFLHAPGRPAVVVDYAHTPDALDKVLEALRRHTSGALVCVFGCGGDRDPGKRPLMAQAAERRADVIWMTSDNPRLEDPERIIDDMAAGLRGAACTHRCVDRREAIARAVENASAGDLVVVAGKGHEDYQEVAGRRLSYSDRVEVANALGVNV